ncbi:hypothetical protein RCL1_007246 [Eukaryota sp. TZLM3-RCL]
MNINVLSNKQDLLKYFILAYALSFLIWVPLIFVPVDTEELGPLLMLLGVWGPMLAAYLVSKQTQTTSLFWKSSFLVKVDWIWYVYSLGIPLVINVIVIFSAHILAKSPDYSAALVWWLYPFLFLFMALLGGGMEEPGWRGFAILRLLTMFNPFVSSVILGLVWTYWHTPLFFIPFSYQASYTAIDIFLWYPLAVTSLAIIMTWLFIKSGGSGFLAIIFHAGINAVNNFRPEFTVGYINTFVVGEIAIFVTAVVVVLLNRQMFFTRWTIPSGFLGLEIDSEKTFDNQFSQL